MRPEAIDGLSRRNMNLAIIPLQMDKVRTHGPQRANFEWICCVKVCGPIDLRVLPSVALQKRPRIRCATMLFVAVGFSREHFRTAIEHSWVSLSRGRIDRRRSATAAAGISDGWAREPQDGQNSDEAHTDHGVAHPAFLRDS